MVHPNSLANLIPYEPGESGNPDGRKTAGAYIKECINAFYAQDLSLDDIRKIARDPKAGCRSRTAAERVLRAMEAGDLADFAGLLRGENNLEDLRAMGVNTEVIKKCKQKTRKIVGQDGAVEELVEREVELHDRAGEDFDRVCDRTEGKPKQSVTHDGDIGLRTQADGVAAMDQVIARFRETLGSAPGGPADSGEGAGGVPD